MIGVLSAIDRPALLVPGINETDDALRAACVRWPAARVLHGEVAEIDDVRLVPREAQNQPAVTHLVYDVGRPTPSL